jgi:hypothetical protein
LDRRALGYAILIEASLLALAAFGGPHGQFGGLPWALQLPGILLVLYPPGGTLFLLRVAMAAVLQVGLWYLILSRFRRRRVRGARSARIQ